MSTWLLALLLAAAGAPAAAAREPVAAIDACIRQLDPTLDVGYARIVQRCPDLAPALTASAWAARLPPDWNKPGNELSAGGLAELRALMTRQPSAASVRAPRVDRVAAVLAGIKLNDHVQEGWWARLKRWLRALLTPRAANPNDSWLRRLFGELAPSQSVLDAIAWTATAVVILLAGTILVNELRLAGWLGAGRRRSVQGAAAGTAAGGRATLEQVLAAGPAQQPRLLLELIVARLREQGRLPPARALTVHELERAARLPGGADRERLAVLTATCEQVRFAAREVPPQSLAAALARGRELLSALEAPAGELEGVR
jgi:hypothetical protein